MTSVLLSGYCCDTQTLDHYKEGSLYDMSSFYTLFSEVGPVLPVNLCFGESFSFEGRLFLIGGHTGTTWTVTDIAYELVNDATEWISRPAMARKGSQRAAFIYNDREDRMLKGMFLCIY